MKRLLVWTSNVWKKDQYRLLLKPFMEDLILLFLDDFKKVSKPLENWKSLEENSYIKSKYFYDIFWIPTLSDDIWMFIEELDWEPWIMPRRWWWELPDNVTDEEWLWFYLSKVWYITKDIFKWYFKICRCLYLWEWKYYYNYEIFEQFFTKKPRDDYFPWFPASAVSVMFDWRHRLDVPYWDPSLHYNSNFDEFTTFISKLF